MTPLFPEVKTFSDLFVALHEKPGRPSQVTHRRKSDWMEQDEEITLTTYVHVSLQMGRHAVLKDNFAEILLDNLAVPGSIFFEVIPHPDGTASVYAKYNSIIASRLLAILSTYP